MMKTPRPIPLFIVAVAVVAAALVPNASLARTVTIAVVRDGPSTDDRLVPLIEGELAKLAGDGVTIRLAQAPEFDAGFTAEGARRAIGAALRAKSVDYLLGLGLLVTQEAARPDLDLTKPFVSAFDQRADLPRLPWAGDGSTKKNLALMVIPQRAERDIETMQRLVPFERLYVGIDADLAQEVAGLAEGLRRYQEALGIDIVPVDVGGDPETAVPPDARALYTTDLPRLGPDERRALFAALAARGVAVFSSSGHGDVEAGAFASLTPDVTELLVRRVALNFSRLIRGETTADLPVVLPVDTKLLINARTALAIGYEPDAEILARAAFLHPEALEADADPLTLVGAMSAAQESNAALAVKTAAVETSRRDRQSALSPLLPQIGVDATVNKSQTLFPNSLLPEESGTAGVRVSQMLYDDRLVSGYRASGRLHEGTQLDREAERLDVMAEAGARFLLLVQARALLRIEADNVRLTEDNLELSRVRYDVGYSGRDEVFRWEAELARRRSDLLASDANVRESRIVLNQVMGVAQDRPWAPEKIGVEPGRFPFLGGRVPGVLDNATAARRFERFLVDFATDNAPELALYDRLLEAQGIQVGERKRSFLLPAFFFDFSYDYFFEWSPDVVARRDDTWSARVYAVYPLFQGGNRYYELKREQSAREGLENERELSRQLVERRVRTAMQRVESGFPMIVLSLQAAEASRQNLDVVQEKYAEGILNVTDLLEAQNQSFTSDQAAAISVYQFLVDLIDLQRAVAWFEAEKTDAELDELAAAIRRALSTQ
jgi:outer membrane protein TolC